MYECVGVRMHEIDFYAIGALRPRSRAGTTARGCNPLCLFVRGNMEESTLTMGLTVFIVLFAIRFDVAYPRTSAEGSAAQRRPDFEVPCNISAA